MHDDDKEPAVPLDDIARPRTTTDVPIEVRSYSGHRADERPVSFDLDGRRVGVQEILFAWIEEDSLGARRRYCYQVATDDGERRTIFYDAAGSRWFLRREKDAKSGT